MKLESTATAPEAHLRIGVEEVDIRRRAARIRRSMPRLLP